MEPWLRNFMIGDAYGAGFEFRPAAYIAAFNDGKTYRAHGLDEAHVPGSPTDDTQMTLAVINVLRHGNWGQPVAYADEFVRMYRESPASGYGAKMRELLPAAAHVSEPGRFLIHSCLPFTTKDTSGAAMRAIPCGLPYGAGSSVIFRALTSARVTHHHPDSINAAVVVALCAYDPSPKGWDDALSYVGWPPAAEWSPGEWKRTTQGKDIVRGALGLLTRCRSLAELLTESIALGGDVDTLAAIALGLGTLAGLPDDLPEELIAGLLPPHGAR